MVHGFQANATRDADNAEVYTIPAGKKLPSVEALRRITLRGFKSEHRVRLVSGFYNESLTSRLARQALPARYVEFDCDLMLSTFQALR